MIGALTGRADGDRLAGSLAAAVIASMNGARIIRAHDVRETVDALRVVAQACRVAGQSRPDHAVLRNRWRSRARRDPPDDGRIRIEARGRGGARARARRRPRAGRQDTRLSGYMFEAALEAGFVAAGVDVLLVGPLPTPGIAYLVQRLGCDFGAVISASHNRFDDNGIKFFDREGSKLADELEEAIESHLDEPAPTLESAKLGRATRVDRERTLYQDFLRLDACRRHAPRRAQARHRLRERRRIQGRAARAHRARRRDHPDRLLAEWPQHQRRLRLDGAGACCS